jgi:transcriptional regulator with PAS, ATPase and Fis domain
VLEAKPKQISVPPLAAAHRQVVIVTKTVGTRLEAFLRKNLEEVLGGWVDIRSFALDQPPSEELVDADVVLVMVPSMLHQLKTLVPEVRRAIVVQRTIRRKDVHRILAIPHGSRVLVVNDSTETTTQTVALLHQLEIEHLHFVPSEPGQDCADIRIAITPGEAHLVPGHIRTVIDVGHRCIDISTFIEIIDRLGIAFPELDQRLLDYSETIVALDRGIDAKYRELVVRNMELNAVLNLGQDGILLLNPAERVAFHNQALARLLGLKRNLQGASASVLPAAVQEALSMGPDRECVMTLAGRTLAVDCRRIEHLGEYAGLCFRFWETPEPARAGNKALRSQEKGLYARYRFEDVLTRSPAMEHCLGLARQMAKSDLTVLIIGETGTGKELLAQSIHQASARGKSPFIAINCAAVPESLLESELFGYEGGSFTGALKEGKAGLFELADHGTVLLDEIGDMPLALQAKLLRVLQERQVCRVGSQQVINVDIRVIAATNRDLGERIRSGRFREDLYYRLNTLPLNVPPLRERPDDVIPLLMHFLAEQQRPGLVFTAEAKAVLQAYAWPGNIRELDNVAKYVGFMGGASVDVPELPPYLLQESGDFDREEAALAAKGGLDKAQAVLCALAETPHGAGRKRIEALLAARGTALTEGTVRRTLAQLAELGLVHSGEGHYRSELTLRGRQFLVHLV